MGKRAQHIPSWPGVIHSNKGRIHLRRPTRDITFRLRQKRQTIHPGLPVSRNNHPRARDGLLAVCQLDEAAPKANAARKVDSRIRILTWQVTEKGAVTNSQVLLTLVCLFDGDP